MPRFLTLLAALVLTGAPEVPAAQAEPTQPFVFHLVPSERWRPDEAMDADFLPEGTVYLYREGSHVPELVGAANQPLHVPPGTWRWMAEAPGYAGVGTNQIPASGSGRNRSFVVPVVPACRVTLADDPRWRHLDRLDVAALDAGAVYPVRPTERRSLWVPAGRHLAYTVRNERIAGITSVAACRRDEEVALPFPEPPAAGRHAVVATLELPSPLAPPDLARLDVQTVGPDLQEYADGELWQGRRGALFFLSLPAEQELRLRAAHPDLRTRELTLAGTGGAVHEVDLGTLAARRGLEVSVDYRPARPHDKAVLELQRCGRERQDHPSLVLRPRCGSAVETLPLQEGPAGYRFPRLDDGQYVVTAVIDGEEIPGLGHELRPWLDPASDAPPAVEETVVLQEMHVFGNLLRDGEPVDGTVRLTSWAAGAAPVEAFPTDGEGLYHLYYFARTPDQGYLAHLPEEVRQADDTRGLYCCHSLTACDADGLCRTFNRHSTFTGEGRFDLELGGAGSVEVQVVDAATGEPLPGAEILVKPGLAFHFHHGEVLWREPLGQEPESLLADAGGRARYAPPTAGPQRAYAVHEGYETGSAATELAEGGTATLRIELQPEASIRGARLVLPGGEPIAGAELLAFEDGQGDRECLHRTDGEGRVQLAAACVDRDYLVAHPRAGLQALSGSRLAGADDVTVRPRPLRPVTVRLVDEDGEPVRTFLQTRLGALWITPNDLAGKGDTFLATGSDGTAVLRGLDPAAAGEVMVAPAGGWTGDWVRLRPEDAGTVVELVAEPAS